MDGYCLFLVHICWYGTQKEMSIRQVSVVLTVQVKHPNLDVFIGQPRVAWLINDCPGTKAQQCRFRASDHSYPMCLLSYGIQHATHHCVKYAVRARVMEPNESQKTHHHKLDGQCKLLERRRVKDREKKGLISISLSYLIICLDIYWIAERIWR